MKISTYFRNKSIKKKVVKTKKPLSKKTMSPHESGRVQQQQTIEQGLRQSRLEYMNLFKRCPEALAYTNIDGIILDVNHHFETMVGYSCEDIRGKSLVYLLHPDDASFFGDQRADSVEMLIHKKSQQKGVVMVKKRFSQVGQRIAGIIYLFRDISNEKHQQQVNEILYHISNAANSNLSLQELYPLIHEELSQLIDTTNFYIAMIDTQNNQLSFPYYRDEVTGEDDSIIARYATSNSIFHYIIRTGKPVLMDYPRYRKMLSYGYIQSWDVMTNTHLWMGVPLKIKNKVIGVIALQSYHDARLYSQSDINLLEFVSQQIAMALYRKQNEERLKQLSLYDFLTGLPNRVLFEDRLQQEVIYAKREKSHLAVIFVDLDDFKQINDHHGHNTGDRLLQEIAKRLSGILRKADSVCRIGGDEFILLLPHLASMQTNMEEIIQKIRQKCSEPILIEENTLEISASIGISFYPRDGIDPQVLIKKADQAMYQAKKMGKNCYKIYNNSDTGT